MFTQTHPQTIDPMGGNMVLMGTLYILYGLGSLVHPKPYILGIFLLLWWLW